MVTYEQPYGKPAAPEQIVITITLGEGMRTPKEVHDAITYSLQVYGAAHQGTRTPFAQQPGYPQGLIRNGDQQVVGEWRVTS